MTAEGMQRRLADDPAELLRRTWQRAPGLIGFLAATGHKQVAARFVVTALVAFLLGGVQALLIRTQLAQPNNDFLDPDLFNGLFTMHGTTMMFLFVVPFMESVGAYLLPLMLGTRDLPFSRLNAFNYWIYLGGIILLYSSFPLQDLPDAGWFAYPPLSGDVYNPGLGMDLWLIGISLVEVASIGAAIELIVLILRQRAPGMSINRMPLFAWAMLAISIAIVFAFTVLLTGSIMLELDRSLDTHFYTAEAGGDPVLWQHLFWVFGHPEVYIMFLPATGIVSQVVATFSGRPIVGYVLVALSIVATAFLSFGLWVHHMFTVGIPFLALGIFSAASYMITIPTGVQIFAWIATIWRGRPRLQLPMLFVLATIVTFVIGGISGVMVASVPFDWQVHDSYFVVAHFHYVLIPGVVFPAFAGLYYWLPKATGHVPQRAISLWSFWTIVIGFNLTFFPMHLSGLFGMPRRVFTYDDGLGLERLNLVSTVGAFLLALGFGLSILAFLMARRWGTPAGGDPWEGETLEWSIPSPPPPENFRRLPIVGGRSPMWEPPTSPSSRHEEVVDALAERPVTWRGLLATTPADAEPSSLVFVPAGSMAPLGAAGGAVLASIGAVTKALPLIVLGLVVLAWGLASWLIDVERSRRDRTSGFEVAGLKVDVLGSEAVGWWGMVAFLAVAASVSGTLVFSYLFLRTREQPWIPPGLELPGFGLALVLGLVLALAALATRLVGTTGGIALRRRWWLLSPALLLGLAAAVLHVVEYVRQNFELDTHAYGSLFFAFHGFGTVLAVIGVSLTLRASFAGAAGASPARFHLLVDYAVLLWWFALAAWAVTLVTLYLSPQLL